MLQEPRQHESQRLIASSKSRQDEPFSDFGDIDDDGVPNVTEYKNVVAAGGSLEGFAEAALDPALDGKAADLPVAGSLALSLVALLLATAAVFAQRRKGRERSTLV